MLSLARNYKERIENPIISNSKMGTSTGASGPTEFQRLIIDVRDVVATDPAAIENWGIISPVMVQSVVDRPVVTALLREHQFYEAIKFTLERWASANPAVATLTNFVKILRKYYLTNLANTISNRWHDVLTSSVSILELGAENKVQIAVQTLNGILAQVGNRPVAIYSINGKKRGGKSFMLNMFLKYLQFGRAHPNDWINQMLPKTFIWRGGEKAVTNGIQVWPEVHTVGEKDTAILLMDGQGLFDMKTDNQGCALIFAFSALLSSVNIYNVKNVGGDTLQFLHTFVEYAKLASPEETERNSTTTGAVFQKLLMLVRDYKNSTEYGFGLHDDKTCPRNEAGVAQNLKNHYFDDFDEMGDQAKSTSQAIQSNFQDVGVFALPFPGTQLDTYDDEDPLSWEPKFRQHVVKFVEQLFTPSAVEARVKVIGGEEMTGNKMMDYVTAWANMFNDANTFPELKSVLQTTADVQGRQHMEKALKFYTDGMGAIVKGVPGGIIQSEFDEKHGVLRASSIEMLRSMRRIGGKPIFDLMEPKINSVYLHYKELNANNILASAQLEKEREARKEAKDFAIKTAEINLDDARRSLEAARTRLTAVHQNQEPYYDHTTVAVKHKTRFMGFNSTPYYTYEPVKTFNQGRFDAAVGVAKQDVENEEARVQAALALLEAAQNQP